MMYSILKEWEGCMALSFEVRNSHISSLKCVCFFAILWYCNVESSGGRQVVARNAGLSSIRKNHHLGKSLHHLVTRMYPIFLGLFKVMLDFPSGKSTTWGIYREFIEKLSGMVFLFCSSLRKSKACVENFVWQNCCQISVFSPCDRNKRVKLPKGGAPLLKWFQRIKFEHHVLGETSDKCIMC